MAKPRLPMLTIACAMAVALACALCTGVASAAQLEAAQLAEGQASAQGEALSPQAATKTVYVIASTSETSDFFGHVNQETTEFTYNENGLLTKRAASSTSGKRTTTYSYKGTTLKSAKQAISQTNIRRSHSAKYTTNKKGKFTKAVQVISDGEGKTTHTFTAKYKSGRISKLVSKNEYTASDGSTSSPATTDTYLYTYKKGRVASRTMNSYKATYSYDKMGNLSIYTNKYNAKKRLTKQTQTTPGTKWTMKYKYKPIKVKASVSALVQAQQWAIINNNYNFAFGVEGIFN